MTHKTSRSLIINENIIKPFYSIVSKFVCRNTRVLVARKEEIMPTDACQLQFVENKGALA